MKVYSLSSFATNDLRLFITGYKGMEILLF